jgi:hypothetical protein
MRNTGYDRRCVQRVASKGGVVGRTDYLIYTVFYFPTRVVDSLIYSKKSSIPGT